MYDSRQHKSAAMSEGLSPTDWKTAGERVQGDENTSYILNWMVVMGLSVKSKCRS